jgi:putative Mg2+ transporter-C (MgtC) family protein
MTVSIEQAALDLAVALCLSAIIGFERQWRNRLAGLRTNTLVALGAASFVIFASLVPGESSPTRVAAQVVSGIGFLGAGLIFREGLSVRGLNTAATLWCSGACGALAGAGLTAEAGFCALGVIVINLGLRPMRSAISRWAPQPGDIETDYRLDIQCEAATEPDLRTLLLGNSLQGGLGLKSLHSDRSQGSVKLVVELAAHGRADAAVEEIASRLGAEEGVLSVRWSVDAQPPAS